MVAGNRIPIVRIPLLKFFTVDKLIVGLFMIKSSLNEFRYSFSSQEILLEGLVTGQT